MEITKQLKSVTEQMLELIGIEAEVTVTKSPADSEEDKVYEVHIDSEKEKGLLIGTHGATLAAIQSFLGMALKQETGNWVRVAVNIGDWKQKQEDHLAALANQTAQRALQTGQPQRLYNLTPSQRRVVHMVLSENKEIVTESQGEGTERYLVVSPKQ